MEIILDCLGKQPTKGCKSFLDCHGWCGSFLATTNPWMVEFLFCNPRRVWSSFFSCPKKNSINQQWGWFLVAHRQSRSFSINWLNLFNISNERILVFHLVLISRGFKFQNLLEKDCGLYQKVTLSRVKKNVKVFILKCHMHQCLLISKAFARSIFKQKSHMWRCDLMVNDLFDLRKVWFQISTF